MQCPLTNPGRPSTEPPECKMSLTIYYYRESQFFAKLTGITAYLTWRKIYLIFNNGSISFHCLLFNLLFCTIHKDVLKDVVVIKYQKWLQFIDYSSNWMYSIYIIFDLQILNTYIMNRTEYIRCPIRADQLILPSLQGYADPK